MSTKDKVVVWLHGEVRTPPFSSAARIEAGNKCGQNSVFSNIQENRDLNSLILKCKKDG